MATKWTYKRHFWAHYGDRFVTVPDQVANDQKGFAEANRSFPARTSDGSHILVRVDAVATGLFTSGTGDLVVQRA